MLSRQKLLDDNRKTFRENEGNELPRRTRDVKATVPVLELCVEKDNYIPWYTVLKYRNEQTIVQRNGQFRKYDNDNKRQKSFESLCKNA